MHVPTVRMVRKQGGEETSAIVNEDEVELWKGYGFSFEVEAASAPAAEKAAPKRRKGK